jgi:ABC-type sugar transport system substrate-binding protein
MSDKSIVLFLVERSDFQELLRQDAEEAARRAGLRLETHFTGHDFAAQSKAMRDVINSATPPNAILVLSVRDHGLILTVRAALRAGISVVFTTRTDDDFSEIRPEAVQRAGVSEICADEVETGRIQGRQFRTLLPGGGRVLYVQGGLRSLSSRDRTRGMQEAVQGTALDLTLVEAGWSEEEARAAVYHRVSLLMRIRSRIDLIGCQTDQIAVGALKALDQLASELEQPDIAKIPITGCDASPSLGQPLVRSGRLVASVSLPRVTGPAVEAIAKSFAGTPLPPTIFFKGASFPPEDQLKALPPRA